MAEASAPPRGVESWQKIIEALQERDAAQAEEALRADLVDIIENEVDFGAAIAAAPGTLAKNFDPAGASRPRQTIDFVLQLVCDHTIIRYDQLMI